MKTSPKVSKFSLGINVARLRKSHRDVKSQIARELRRPAPCTLALQQLKRRRLQIKDEIARCLDRLRRLEASSTLPPHMA
jgi:hypothetical protein